MKKYSMKRAKKGKLAFRTQSQFRYLKRLEIKNKKSKKYGNYR